MKSNLRCYSILDEGILQYHNFFETVFNQSKAKRPNPAEGLTETALTFAEKENSVRFMRVNHSGEVCAQALYHGQMIVAQNLVIRSMLAIVSEEEIDHLVWCKNRIEELGGRVSYLNIFWYSTAFLIGLLAGTAGDQLNLGFFEETEKQVELHLEGHLRKLPFSDIKSRQIVKQMQRDEISHSQKAKLAGAKKLPYGIKKLMSFYAKVMTTLSYWI